jgi:NAD(P)-dependent dehydrogenase (short-subunit alcohol dehydrogenase family)
MVDYTGQVTIVTGSGHGLGRSHALELARRGATVVVNDNGVLDDGRPSAPAVVEEITAAGGKAVADRHSVAEPSQAAAMVEEALDRFGRVDALINNAGVSHFRSFEDLTLEDFDAIHALHLRGPMVATQVAYRSMLSSGYGRIVFTASGAGVFGRFQGAAYSSAKTALIGLMNVISLEGEPHNIKANAVLPTAATGIKGTNPDGISALLKKSATVMRKAGEFGDPAFVTPLVVYLASADCRETRHIYSAASGRYARVFIALTEGWLAEPSPPTVESLMSHWTDIEQTTVWNVPDSIDEEIAEIAKRRTGIDPHGVAEP